MYKRQRLIARSEREIALDRRFSADGRAMVAPIATLVAQFAFAKKCCACTQDVAPGLPLLLPSSGALLPPEGPAGNSRAFSHGVTNGLRAIDIASSEAIDMVRTAGLEPARAMLRGF